MITLSVATFVTRIMQSTLFLIAIHITVLLNATVKADEVTLASGAVGNDIKNFRTIIAPWEKATGHTVELVSMPSSTSDQFGQYRLWLAAGNSDIDLYRTDVIWAPQLAEQFIDLSAAAKDIIPLHFPTIIQSQTVNKRLIALPLFTDAPALYYRTDLLEKYNVPVPKTWQELTAAARKIQDGERAGGHDNLWGYVFQGNAYEGLTCNALEWVKSFGGGQIIQPDGTISIDNKKAIAALELAATWPGNISPEGVLAYKEEEARGIWQTGNAVFMRNWPYAYALSNNKDSAVKGKFDVVPLPSGGADHHSAATLGGWNIAVSKYSKKKDIAISLALYLAGSEAQKMNSLIASKLPTIMSLYDDPQIIKRHPIIPRWKEVFPNAVPRPSAPTKGKYNEVSSKFWSAVHNTLSKDGTAAENLELLQIELKDLKGSGW